MSRCASPPPPPPPPLPHTLPFSPPFWWAAGWAAACLGRVIHHEHFSHMQQPGNPVHSLCRVVMQADLEGEMEGMTAGGTEEAEPGTPAAPLRTLDLGADGAWGAAEPATAAADAEIPAAEEADGKKLSKMQKKRAKAEKEAAIRKAVCTVPMPVPWTADSTIDSTAMKSAILQKFLYLKFPGR